MITHGSLVQYVSIVVEEFKSMHGVNMHSKMTATRNVVNFIYYGNYGKKGFRNESSLNCQSMKYTHELECCMSSINLDQ